jgi:hypothetical protein
MVIVLVLLPLSVAGSLLALELAFPADLVVPLASSPVLYPLLAGATLLAILVSAYRSRFSVVLLSAWLFLFCGALLLSVAQLIELFRGSQGEWASDIVEAVAFVPLLMFTGFVAAPLRLLAIGRRRRLLLVVLIAVFVLLVALIAAGPWLGALGARSPELQPRLLALLKPELDALLLVPLALLLLAFGLSRPARPYWFIGLGLLAMLPADVLGHYHLLSSLPIQEQLATLLDLTSQAYFLFGAILGTAGGHARPA